MLEVLRLAREKRWARDRGKKKTEKQLQKIRATVAAMTPEERRSKYGVNLGKPSGRLGVRLSESHRAALRGGWVKRKESGKVNHGTRVCANRDGVLIGEWRSISEAARAIGATTQTILRLLKSGSPGRRRKVKGISFFLPSEPTE